MMSYKPGGITGYTKLMARLVNSGKQTLLPLHKSMVMVHGWGLCRHRPHPYSFVRTGHFKT